MIIIPMKNCYFIGNINPTFSDKPMSLCFSKFKSDIGDDQSVPSRHELQAQKLRLDEQRGGLILLCADLVVIKRNNLGMSENVGYIPNEIAI